MGKKNDRNVFAARYGPEKSGVMTITTLLFYHKIYEKSRGEKKNGKKQVIG